MVSGVWQSSAYITQIYVHLFIHTASNLSLGCSPSASVSKNDQRFHAAYEKSCTVFNSDAHVRLCVLYRYVFAQPQTSHTSLANSLHISHRTGKALRGSRCRATPWSETSGLSIFVQYTHSMCESYVSCPCVPQDWDHLTLAIHWLRFPLASLYHNIYILPVLWPPCPPAVFLKEIDALTKAERVDDNRSDDGLVAQTCWIHAKNRELHPCYVLQVC